MENCNCHHAVCASSGCCFCSGRVALSSGFSHKCRPIGCALLFGRRALVPRRFVCRVAAAATAILNCSLCSTNRWAVAAFPCLWHWLMTANVAAAVGAAAAALLQCLGRLAGARHDGRSRCARKQVDDTLVGACICWGRQVRAANADRRPDKSYCCRSTSAFPTRNCICPMNRSWCTDRRRNSCHHLRMWMKKKQNFIYIYHLRFVHAYRGRNGRVWAIVS